MNLRRICVYLLYFLLILITLGAAQFSKIEKQDYLTARGMFDDGYYEMAASQFDNFLKKYPQSSLAGEVRFLRAESYFNLGQYPTAIKMYGDYLSRYPGGNLAAEALLRQGQSYYQNRQFTRAIRQIRKFLATYPGHKKAAEAFFWLGESYYQLQQYGPAEKAYESSLKAPGSFQVKPHVLYSLGWLYKNQSRELEALKKYDELIRQFPQKDLAVEANFIRANIYYGLGEYDKCVQAVLDGLKADNKDKYKPQGLFLMAEALFARGSVPEARDVYRKLLKEFPNHPLAPEAKFSLGWTYFAKNDYGNAFAVFEQLFRQMPDDSLGQKALLYSALSQKRLKAITAAEQLFNRLILNYPASPYADDALYELAGMEFSSGKYGAAVRYLQKLTDVYQQSDLLPLARKMEADSYIAQKQYRQALVALAAIENPPPEIAGEVLFKRGWCQIQVKRYAEAVASLQEYRRRFSNGDFLPEASFWLAEAFYNDRQYENALAAYRQFEKQFPAHRYAADARYGEAWSLYQLNRFEDAIAAFQQLVDSGQRAEFVADGLLRISDAYFALKKYRRALATYRNYLKRFPTGGERQWAQFQSGMCLFKLEKFAEARQAFSRLLKESSGGNYDENALYLTARSYFKQNNFERAIAAYQDFIRKFPHSEMLPRVYYEIGDSYYNQRQYPRSIEAYRQVIEKFPDKSIVGDAISGLQWAAMQMGDVRRAFQIADEYIRKQPDSPLSQELLLRRGDFYFGQKQYSEAISAYRGFLKRYPGSLLAPKALFWIGMSEVNLNQSDNAAKTFRQLIRKYPDNEVLPDALFQLGVLMRKTGNYQKSLQMFTQILQGGARKSGEPSFLSEVHLQRGKTYLLMKREEDARQEFLLAVKKASKAFSGYQARIELARLMGRQKQIDPARRLLNEVIRDRSDELAAEAQTVIGDVYFAAGDYPQALSAYLKVKYVYQAYGGWVAKALYGAGLCNEKLNHPAEARKLYGEVVSKYPAEAVSDQAKKRLAAL